MTLGVPRPKKTPWRPKPSVTERDVDRQFTRGLTKLGIQSIKLTTLGRFGTSGWPDRLVLIPGGQVLFIELKSSRGKRSVLQGIKHEVLAKLGFAVRTFNNSEDALEFVRNFVIPGDPLGVETWRRDYNPELY